LPDYLNLRRIYDLGGRSSTAGRRPPKLETNLRPIFELFLCDNPQLFCIRTKQQFEQKEPELQDDPLGHTASPSASFRQQSSATVVIFRNAFIEKMSGSFTVASVMPRAKFAVAKLAPPN
jgi:hypothetical protein